MTKNDYKRLQTIKKELAQLEQDKEDTLNEIQELYSQRKTKGLQVLHSRLTIIIREECLRETIVQELQLPRYVKMECDIDVKEWFGQNNLDYNHDTLNSLITDYLVDNYNHLVSEFNGVVKGKNIYITNIKWNKNQIVVSDLKHLRKKVVLENDLVDVCKDNVVGVYYIRDKFTNYTCRRNTLRETIKCLESHYFM